MSNPACPACGTRTELVRWEDVAGFACGECRGHFIRAASLQTFFDKHDHLHGRFQSIVFSVRTAPRAARKLACGECGGNDFRILRPGALEIDVCAGCTGIYFDADEATLYFRQTRHKAPGGTTFEKTADALSDAGVIADIFHFLV